MVTASLTTLLKSEKKPPGNFRAACGISMLLPAYFFLETRYATGDAM